MTELLTRLKQKLRSETGIRIILLIGFAGMALILLSGMLGGEQHSARKSAKTDTDGALAAEEYRVTLESRLEEMLGRMEGVGEVTVMITLSSSAEQVYAEEVKASQNDRGSQKESAYVLTRKDGDESALVAEIRYPAVQGAVILCSGGGHAAIQERIRLAAATVLGIPETRVYVGQSTVN